MKKITRFFLILVAIATWGSVANATNTACAGTLTTAAQGSFTLGYNYTFTTSGTSVTITFELLDTKTGLVAQLVTPANAYTNMALVSGQKYTYTLTGQTPGATITYACYFAYAGASARTTDLTYTVGDACGTSSDVTKPVMGTAVVVGTPTVSSVNLTLTATDDVTSPVINYVANDATNGITNKALLTNSSGNVTVSGLAASTSYNLTITAKDAAGNISTNSASASFTTASHPVAPTPPTRNAATVIGIYSDTYTCVSNAFQWWAATTSVDVVTGGNTSKLITSGNCFGTQVSTLQDVSSMQFLHVDIYPTTVTTMQIGIVAPAGNEYHPANTLVANQWNSFDISLADFKTGKPSLDLTKLTQVGFWGMNGTFYLDNVYFYTNVVPSLVVSTVSLTIAQPATSTNTFGITTSSTWTVASDQTWLTPSSLSGTGNATITLTATSANSTYSSRTATVTITGSGTTKTITVTQSPLLPSAAPTPTLAAAKVISVYSDAYTNVGSPNFFPGWGQQTVATATTLGGNNAMQYSNFGYQGITLNATDVSSMNKLHVDIFPTTETTVRLTPISHNPGGAEFPTSLGTLTAYTWNSFDIMLTTYTGVVYTAIDQFKFDGGTGGTFYMDNLYFFNDTSTGLNAIETSELVSCYPNPMTDKLTVSAKSEISQVIVRNLVGQTVKITMVNGLEKSIELSNVAAGNYLVTVKLTNGQVSTQKLVKL